MLLAMPPPFQGGDTIIVVQEEGGRLWFFAVSLESSVLIVRDFFQGFCVTI
jgi:hypothetical protein